MNPASCTAGQTEVVKYIKLSCVSAGNVEVVGCVAPNSAEVAIGHTVNDDHFRYICTKDGETVRFYANGRKKNSNFLTQNDFLSIFQLV